MDLRETSRQFCSAFSFVEIAESGCCRSRVGPLRPSLTEAILHSLLRLGSLCFVIEMSMPVRKIRTGLYLLSLCSLFNVL